MAKSKNHTAHNQNRKAHRNGTCERALFFVGGTISNRNALLLFCYRFVGFDEVVSALLVELILSSHGLRGASQRLLASQLAH
jgi:hypothetical protein